MTSSPVQRAAAALDRLERADAGIGAFLPEPNRRRRVLSDAQHLARRSKAAAPTLLLGALVGVKDIINVDGLPTRAGSTLPAELFAGPEAAVVGRLRHAGALIAGKTTTTEFAFSEPSPTHNPRRPGHTPGGSSSGSAAAVAAGAVRVAVGTQTVDSIVTPAAYCGVVGFKPTFGRVPTDGVVPFAPSMDHVGLLTADVSDLAHAASVVCDDWRERLPDPEIVLGIPHDSILDKVSPRVRAAFDAAINFLRHYGYAVVTTEALADVDAIAVTHRRLVAREFATVHAAWFAEFGDRYRTRSAGLFREGAALDEKATAEGVTSGRLLREALEAIERREGVTAFVSPSATDVAPAGLDYIGDPIMGLPWTHAHVPVVSLPIEPYADGLPTGIQLAGRHGDDEALVAIAGRIEHALGRSDLG